MPRLAVYILVFAALVYSVAFAFGEYVDMLDHDLGVMQEMRACVKAGFSDEGRTDCAKKARELWLPRYAH